MPHLLHPLLLLVAVLLLGAPGCGELQVSYETEPSSDEVTVLASWWSEESPPLDLVSNVSLALAETDLSLRRLTLSELRAHAALDEEHEDESTSAHKQAVSRLLAEEQWQYLPDAFLTNDGYDVRRWTPCAGVEPARLVALDEYLDPAWLTNTFPQALLETVSCDGHVYALPLGMHRTNLIAYNRQRLRDAQILSEDDELMSFFAFEQLAERLLRSRFGREREQTFLTLPAGDREAANLFLIDSFLRGSAGAGFEELWQGGAHTRKVEQALYTLSSWRRLVATHTGPSAELLELLQGGETMFAPITRATAAALRDATVPTIGAMGFPGTTAQWVFQLDVFAVPAKPNPTKGIVWVQAIAERDMQERFSLGRPAWPVRSDLLATADRSPQNAGDAEYHPPYAALLLTNDPSAPERRFAERTLQRLADASDDERVVYPTHAALQPPDGSLRDLGSKLLEWLQDELCPLREEGKQTERDRSRAPDPSLSPHPRHEGCVE